jgi:hypothetical protein
MVDLFYNQQENTRVLWTKKLQMLWTKKKKKNKKMQVKTERKWREKAGLDSGVN